MINNEQAYELLFSALNSMRENEYPESAAAIQRNILPEKEIILAEPYEIAEELIDSDKKCTMTAEISDFIVETLTGEIEDNHYEAATELGLLYFTGRMGNPDYKRAVKYFDFAERHGDRDAREYLGSCYYYGKAGTTDYEKAFHCFLSGVIDGRMGSMIKLGDMYRDGLYVKKDSGLAYRIYKKCFYRLDEKTTPEYGAEIAIRIADCNYEGTGTPTDYFNALTFYQKAEQLYYVRAMERRPVPKNIFEKAVKYQEKIRTVLIDELCINQNK